MVISFIDILFFFPDSGRSSVLDNMKLKLSYLKATELNEIFLAGMLSLC